MTWLRLTREQLELREGGNKLDQIQTEKLDNDTLALDVPLNWLRSKDAPTQMIISLDQPAKDSQ